MALDISTTSAIVIAVIVIWPFASWFTYRSYVYMPVEDRDWADDTSAKRIFWVLTGPIYWIILGIWIISEALHEKFNKFRRRIPHHRVKREDRKHDRKTRRTAFMFDPKK